MQNAQRVVKVFEQVKQRAEEMFCMDLSAVELKMDLKGKCAGVAMKRGGCLVIRLNIDMINSEDHIEQILENTIPHEVAHIVCFINPNMGHKHNTGWRYVCIKLGGDGSARHSMQIVYAKGRTFQYIATCGTVCNLSETRHRRIQQGKGYKLTTTGGKLNAECSYRIIGETVTTESVNTVNPPSNMSKAESIRARIMQAKVAGEDFSVVVQYGVDVLGMSKSLASTYVKNNWEKV